MFMALSPSRQCKISISLFVEELLILIDNPQTKATDLGYKMLPSTRCNKKSATLFDAYIFKNAQIYLYDFLHLK